ncbi:hypothetical protein EVAR_89284_1 [Eumeta japonica]|uniref:Uncharacterized protein n=1 Tax=Eumeta variegata TaxID=151549 RepID=A0A4C1YZT4_EUMVA|nr:hypothetical protein EVAR_89284_1 [Eumeta japonica]
MGAKPRSRFDQNEIKDEEWKRNHDGHSVMISKRRVENESTPASVPTRPGDNARDRLFDCSPKIEASRRRVCARTYWIRGTERAEQLTLRFFVGNVLGDTSRVKCAGGCWTRGANSERVTVPPGAVSSAPPDFPPDLRSYSHAVANLAAARKWAGSTEADVIQEERLKILHNNIEPWSLIQHNWQITTELRFKKLAKVEGPLINYFNEFPALKQPEGYQLLCEDFSVKFPGKEEILTSSLILKRDQIIHIAREKLKNTRDNDLKESILRYLDSITDDKPDSKSEVALLLLPYILPILPSRKKGNHIHWKPSRSELRDGFITHVSSSAEVKPTIEQRQIKLSRLGRTFQPIIILTPSSLLKHMRTNRVVCARGTTEYKRGESNCLRHFSSAKAFQRHLLNAHCQLFQPEIARDAENSSQNDLDLDSDPDSALELDTGVDVVRCSDF